MKFPATTLFLTHPMCLEHHTGTAHPERPERLQAIMEALQDQDFADLRKLNAKKATLDQIRRNHLDPYISTIEKMIPQSGLAHLDSDTVVSPASFEAALYAAGACCQAVHEVAAENVRNAFCAVRPPGHHAEPNKAMGFCLFNNVAIAAHEILEVIGLEKVAIMDFDVHHGNGTQAAFWSNPQVFYASIHEWPFYPGTGAREERGAYDNIVNAPLSAGAGSDGLRAHVETQILPKLEEFSPDFILLSAGFDAHRLDPLAGLNLDVDDFVWITEVMMGLADNHCAGRIVSVLEGGYDLDVLRESVAAHVKTLMHFSTANL